MDPAIVDHWGDEVVAEGFEQVFVCGPRMTGTTTCLGPSRLTPAGRCEPVGSHCPMGADWLGEAEIRELAPGFEGRILYAASEASSGTGTRDAPFSVTEALGASNEGDVIALARGVYGGVRVDRGGVAVVGACPLTTRLERGDDDDAALVISGLDGVRVANV
ncbi:MAG: hypothetical protein KDA28_10935, partial [Phycisphaerales bacterium]|nr:hypothetical protein [Phycisphaerales bacterium]